MNGLDMIEDTFPHGTIEGHRLGCKSGACPSKAAGGDSCAQAMIRYRGDWEYKKAVDAGEVPPPMIHDRPSGSKLKAATSSLIIEPTIDVASTIAPPPVEPNPKAARPAKSPAAPKVKKPTRTWRHGTVWGYHKGCRVDEECPAFIEGGRSCYQVAKAYWRERSALNSTGKRKVRSVEERIIAAVGKKGQVESIVESDGVTVVTVRIPASAVAS